MNQKLNPETEVLELEGIDTLLSKKWTILIYDDNINTFKHVIECLVRYCSHNELQAYQCSLIINNCGKCDVKRGDYDELKSIKEALCENGLNAQIECI